MLIWYPLITIYDGVWIFVVVDIAASNISIIKDAESFTDPAYFSAVRFVLATIPFLPSIFQARNDIQIRNSGLELGLWVSLGYLSEALGLLTSDAGRASFISLFTVSYYFEKFSLDPSYTEKLSKCINFWLILCRLMIRN